MIDQATSLVAASTTVLGPAELDALPRRELLTGGLALISVLSVPFVVEELVPKLAAAVDGDPATVVPD